MNKFYFRAYSILIVTMSILTISCLAQSTDNLRWKEGILVDEFIYDSAEFPSVHAATITETPSGLITAFFGGKYEGHPEVNIYTSRHTPAGWTPPVKVADGIVSDTLRKACYNPVLFQYPDGELLLFYKIGKNVHVCPSSYERIR